MTVVVGWPTTRAGQDRLALKVACPDEGCRSTPGMRCGHYLTGNPCGVHPGRRRAARDAVAAGELDRWLR